MPAAADCTSPCRASVLSTGSRSSVSPATDVPQYRYDEVTSDTDTLTHGELMVLVSTQVSLSSNFGRPLVPSQPAVSVSPRVEDIFSGVSFSSPLRDGAAAAELVTQPRPGWGEAGMVVSKLAAPCTAAAEDRGELEAEDDFGDPQHEATLKYLGARPKNSMTMDIR